MATGARSSRSSIAGLTITAYPAPPGILCRKMNRPPDCRRRGLTHERHHPVHGWNSGNCGMVALTATADSQALAGGRADRRFSRTEYVVLAGSEDRTGSVSRCRRLVVRTLHQRLLHAHEHGGLARAARAEAAVVQHRRPGPEQCRAAMGTSGRAAERHGQCNRRPVRRGSIRHYIPGWAAVRVATVERRGVFRGVQSSQFLLLPDHRDARAASDGRSGGAGQNDCQGVAWRRDDTGAPERGTMRYLLAFPAVGLAGPARSADGLDGRFRRHLSPVAQLGEGRDQMAETALTNTGESPARIEGLRGIAADWSSDQRAFKNVSWGKAMMWIFLLSDTFIFSCF